jgi:RNA polymerase sigma-70 factor (ECF subfamily)
VPATIIQSSWSGPWASANAGQATPAVNPEPGTPAVRDWDEATLVQQAQAGNPTAFETLYEVHLGRVYALALRMLRDTRAAEEVTQDIFVRAWEKLGKFEGRSSFGTWIHRLGVNVVLGELRSTQRREARVEPVEDPAMFERELKEAMPETKMDLETAIAGLPDGAREILILHDIEGYKYREIAEMSEIAEGTVKSQLNRARRLVREALLK